MKLTIEIEPKTLRAARARARAAHTHVETVLLRHLLTYAAHGSPHAKGAHVVNAKRSKRERARIARAAVNARWARHRAALAANGGDR